MEKCNREQVSQSPTGDALPPLPSRSEDAVAGLLFKMRDIGIVGTHFEPTQFRSLTEAERKTSDFYKAMAQHLTPDDLDSRFTGQTALVDILAALSDHCSADEVVQLFVLVAGPLPTNRWIPCLRPLCDAQDEEAFLQAFRKSTSKLLASMFNFVLGQDFNAGFALAVAANQIIYHQNIGCDPFLRWKLAIRLPKLRRTAKRVLWQNRALKLCEKSGAPEDL